MGTTLLQAHCPLNKFGLHIAGWASCYSHCSSQSWQTSCMNLHSGWVVCVWQCVEGSWHCPLKRKFQVAGLWDFHGVELHIETGWPDLPPPDDTFPALQLQQALGWTAEDSFLPCSVMEKHWDIFLNILKMQIRLLFSMKLGIQLAAAIT